MSDLHVAQINIGVMVAPTDDPGVAEFMASLDRINAQADSAPGFVWRLQTESGNATDIQIFPDPLRLVKMSVWESVEALKHYVYRAEPAGGRRTVRPRRLRTLRTLRTLGRIPRFPRDQPVFAQDPRPPRDERGQTPRVD